MKKTLLIIPLVGGALAAWAIYDLVASPPRIVPMPKDGPGRLRPFTRVDPKQVRKNGVIVDPSDTVTFR
jgi:hypothetical protein